MMVPAIPLCSEFLPEKIEFKVAGEDRSATNGK